MAAATRFVSSVGGRVLVSENCIGRGQHDFTIHNEKRPERMVAEATSLAGEDDGLPDELLMRAHRSVTMNAKQRASSNVNFDDICW